MRTILAVTMTGILAATAAVLQPRPKPAAVPQAIQKPVPQAAPVPVMTPLAMLQAGTLPVILPIVPEPKTFGQVHVNGQPAFECGAGASGAALMPVMINGVKCARARMWRTEGPIQNVIEVHRDLLQNGVDFLNPNYPPVIVIWWAVLLDSRWQPVVLDGTDYNVSGGAFTVTQ